MNRQRAIEIEARWHAFRALTPYFGRVVTARFIQKTHEVIPALPRIHHLIEGIYKPKDATYALSIASMLKNPYADRIAYRPDRSWYFHYSPKSGSLDSAVNQSLFNCKRDGEPVLVLKQLSDKYQKQGVTYKILGLGLLEDFDLSERLFQISEVTIEQFQQRVDPETILSDDLIETALQLESLEAWSPFVAKERAVYRVSKSKRDTAFRNIILRNYHRTCAVTGTKFSYGNIVEAQAAHIIGKEANGTDDPRNGLALNHTAHWAFDQGLFTVSDQYEILVHPKAKSASESLFPIIERDGKTIALPDELSIYPHPEALQWHRQEIFGKFCDSVS